jgi:hypothetical protein
MEKSKVWPEFPVFFDCGQCGHWHARDLPGFVDCRADEHRFSTSELDDHYGVERAWQVIDLEEQEDGE